MSQNGADNLHFVFEGIREKAVKELSSCNFGDADYAEKHTLLEAMIISCDAVMTYAARYRKLALGMADKCADKARKAELLKIARFLSNVARVKAWGKREKEEEAADSLDDYFNLLV